MSSIGSAGGSQFSITEFILQFQSGIPTTGAQATTWQQASFPPRRDRFDSDYNQFQYRCKYQHHRHRHQRQLAEQPN